MPPPVVLTSLGDMSDEGIKSPKDFCEYNLILVFLDTNLKFIS